VDADNSIPHGLVLKDPKRDLWHHVRGGAAEGDTPPPYFEKLLDVDKSITSGLQVAEAIMRNIASLPNDLKPPPSLPGLSWPLSSPIDDLVKMRKAVAREKVKVENYPINPAILKARHLYYNEPLSSGKRRFQPRTQLSRQLSRYLTLGRGRKPNEINHGRMNTGGTSMAGQFVLP
jgi:hypothetical protein